MLPGEAENDSSGRILKVQPVVFDVSAEHEAENDSSGRILKAFSWRMIFVLLRKLRTIHQGEY